MLDYLIGGSPAIKRIKASLTKLSADMTPVVIIGEPGVGKTLLSSRIHANSLLRHRSIESINFQTYNERDQRIGLLGGVPPELPTSRRSILELPTTVVLKHIDCATQFLQERLAESIRNRRVVRLGTVDPRPIRCKLIFVLSYHPRELSKKGNLIPNLSKIFSKYELISLPSLKKRKEDIPELAQHFFTQFRIQRKRRLNPRFVEHLKCHTWSENILELKAFIKTLQVLPDQIALQGKDRIELAKINLMIDEGRDFSLKESVSHIECEVSTRALRKNNDCRTRAARSLGMTDFTLRQLVEFPKRGR